MNLKNIQRTICFAVGLLCMGLRPEVALAAAVISGYEVEPNNTYATANGTVASGALIRGSTTTSGTESLGSLGKPSPISRDYDVFAIYASAPGLINLNVSCGDACSLSVVLSNVSGTILAQGASSYSSRTLTTALAGAGSYYIVISRPTDGTTTYSFTVTYPDTPVAPVATTKLKVGPIFSTAQTSSQSFVRFYNSGTAPGTVVASLYDYSDGRLLGSWTSPSIPAGAQVQYSASTIESGIGLLTKPDYYLLSVDPGATFKGSFQHVLYRPASATFSNLSTCDSGFATSATKTLIGVHTSIIEGYGFPSYIAINNTGASATTVSLGIYDARNGTKLGTVNTASVPSNSLSFVTMSSLEKKAGISPTSSMDHYVVKAESDFTGYLQHLVNSNSVNLLTDITTTCSLGSP